MTDPEEPQDDVAPAPSATVATDDETSDLPDEESDYGPPFSAKTFGGSFVWARGEQYVASVLRVKEGENVVVSTANRRDMNVMLTGGRAVLEVDDGSDSGLAGLAGLDHAVAADRHAAVVAAAAG